MTDSFTVYPSCLTGSLTIPPSKSHTLRAILFGALASGTSFITHFLLSPDTLAMIEAVRLLGAAVHLKGTVLEIKGFAGKPQPSQDVIECGNSGIILRFIGALAGLLPTYTTLTGDLSIRTNRPVDPLLNGLAQLGAFAVSSRGNGCAPILIRGPLTGSHAEIDGRDSQPVSGLLIASAFAPHPITLQVHQAGEGPWIDVTLDWFQRLAIPFERFGYSRYRLEGGAQIKGFTYDVPGDWSTAAFPLAAALITQSALTLNRIHIQDSQGDKAIIPLLQKMGAHILVDTQHNRVTVEKGGSLNGIRIDINPCIDALPILAVLGCFAKGRTEIVNGAIARKKETDRIEAITEELKKMGARIEEKPDGLIIHPSALYGAELNTHGDHRLGLALTVAALGAKTPSKICGITCIAKTHPHFQTDFQSIGAIIQ